MQIRHLTDRQLYSPANAYAKIRDVQVCVCVDMPVTVAALPVNFTCVLDLQVLLTEEFSHLQKLRPAIHQTRLP